MRNIEIDDEVFAYLQSKAIPFVETPNLTLRRLFELDKCKLHKPNVPSTQETRTLSRKKKQSKTALPSLVHAGLLQEGQTLYLHDYQGKKFPGYEVAVSGKSLLWNSQLFSMSQLAKNFLKQEGFSSNSVRGPARWYNADGISIKELWDQYLNKGGVR